MHRSKRARPSRALPLVVEDRSAQDRAALELDAPIPFALSELDAPIPFALTDAASAMAGAARPSRRRAVR